ncbi:hypothetical protein FHS15_004980 [Paenibacillus castaneae]|uniref:hypothetical protein n=1 Tax=Paenibacillus castaneae TaxID=474957 RepID=UPI000C9AB5D6|nr:hypothetical protein [Paenibacillus castaneae]NIK79813.1 hypothetical protein [Paenibacillus castaneae]
MAMNLYEVNEWNSYSPTSEEMRLIHDCIFLPLTLIVIEQNRLLLDKNARSLRSVFIKAANVIGSKIEADLAKAKGLLLRQNIIVHNGDHRCYSYHCRGYEEQLTFSREFILGEINARITAYTKRIFNHQT